MHSAIRVPITRDNNQVIYYVSVAIMNILPPQCMARI